MAGAKKRVLTPEEQTKTIVVEFADGPLGGRVLGSDSDDREEAERAAGRLPRARRRGDDRGAVSGDVGGGRRGGGARRRGRRPSGGRDDDPRALPGHGHRGVNPGCPGPAESRLHAAGRVCRRWEWSLPRGFLRLMRLLRRGPGRFKAGVRPPRGAPSPRMGPGGDPQNPRKSVPRPDRPPPAGYAGGRDRHPRPQRSHSDRAEVAVRPPRARFIRVPRARRIRHPPAAGVRRPFRRG